MYVSLVRKGDSVTGAQNIDVPSQAAGQQAARHDHVTAVTGVWGGGGGAPPAHKRGRQLWAPGITDFATVAGLGVHSTTSWLTVG
jgi:hypothetical protein